MSELFKGKKLFGTDGIRGSANSYPMNAETAMKVGIAAGSIFTNGNHRHRVVIGKDTRLSGYMIESALTAGFISVGMDVILVGPMPTPAIAMLTRSLRADLGVVISASHNPFCDNGIKLFGPDGFKLSDGIESEIEQRIFDKNLATNLASPENLGRAKRLDDAPGRYIEYVKGSFPKGKTLDKLKIVIDCANGAAYHLGPTILWELGAEVIAIGVEPDGFNINMGCGSTNPALLSKRVLEEKADLGIALDGDADRLIIVDEKGNVVDGDQLLACISTFLFNKGFLKGDGVVATHMSNMGLENHLKKLNLKLHRTKVGDRYVIEEMKRHSCNIGGEQSGHIVLSDFSTTGDGIIAALQILRVIIDQNKPASECLRSFEPFPQILKNVRFSGKNPLDDSSVQSLIDSNSKKLGTTGRLYIRTSGTEPLIRIMGESDNRKLLENVIDEIAEKIHAVAK